MHGAVTSMIFDERERSDLDPAGYAEPHFDYLNRSARPEAERVRELFEAWAAKYPTDSFSELRARLRSAGHVSAFFELALHEMMHCLGFTVEIHPEVNCGTDQRPDFLVGNQKENLFYLEAILASDSFEPDAATRARMDQVYDALNRLNSPNFFLNVDVSGAPNTPPPGQRIRKFLKRKLDKLDPDEIGRLINADGLDALPKWVFEHDGWRLEFSPIPKSPDARGKPGIRPIGILSPEAKWIDTRRRIRDAVRKKGGKYGDLGLPYIVAVNSLSPHVHEIDIMEALFGKETFVFDRGDPDKSPKMKRRLNGAWTSPAGAVYTRVSGVLIANNLTPWNVARSFVRLYHNPWAKRPISQQLFPIPQAVPDDNTMRQVDGLAIRDVFDLPERWPED